MINIEEVKATVKRIDSIKEDDEAAHIAEDELHVRFIEYVSETAGEPLRSMAQEILKTNAMEFYRWYA